MCFGRKRKKAEESQLCSNDEPPRPAPDYSLQKPTYINLPKAGSIPQQSHPSPPQPSPASLASPDAMPLAPQASSPDPSASKATKNWEIIVPDPSLFPPLPALFSGLSRSSTGNALKSEAEAAEFWCAEFPLAAPLTLDAPSLAVLQAHDIRLMTPASGFRGTLEWRAPGVWAGKTDAATRDSCVMGYPPLYAVREHSPLVTGQVKTVYYEVAVGMQGTGDVCLALGFTALPYPSFRMPGWHRGSLAVHGDDGLRYVNDQWEGKEFTEPFRRGGRYGIGMVFREESETGKIKTEVYFTHGGRLVGGWNLHGGIDVEEDSPVTGLEGYHDLSCAVGVYQANDFEVILDPERWLYKPGV